MRSAFWNYDIFPFMRGGEVEKVHSDGTVSVMGYGPYRFERAVIVTNPDGEDLCAELCRLATEYRVAKDALDAEWSAKADALRAQIRSKGTEHRRSGA